jgi:hypothetical protein
MRFAMSDDWEIEGTKHSAVEAGKARFFDLASAGLLGEFPADKTYVMKNKETGERREVTTRNEKKLGRK